MRPVKLVLPLLLLLAFSVTRSAPNVSLAAKRTSTISRPVDVRAIVGIDTLRISLMSRDVGTGVIVDAGGIIITASHVIEGADVLNVTLADGRIVSGRVIATDPQADLALIRIDGQALPVVALASLPVVGSAVQAIGRERHARAGSILRIEERGRDIHELSTDALFHEGDSGGALVDGQGKLVGVLLGVGEHDQRIAVGTAAVKILVQQASS